MSEEFCGVCYHHFKKYHFERDRHIPHLHENDRRKCDDCVKCYPPKDPDRGDVRVGELVGV